MELNLLERLMSIQALAEYKEGNFITFKTIASLRNKLFITEAEAKRCEVRIESGRYIWNNAEGSKAVEIEITEAEHKLLKEQLEKMDKANKLTPDYLSLYELIVGNETSETK